MAPPHSFPHRRGRRGAFPLADRSRYNRPVMIDGDVPVQVRSFRPGDQQACNRLYREGLIGGAHPRATSAPAHRHPDGSLGDLRDLGVNTRHYS